MIPNTFCLEVIDKLYWKLESPVQTWMNNIIIRDGNPAKKSADSDSIADFLHDGFEFQIPYSYSNFDNINIWILK